MIPDEATKTRLMHLAQVGNALNQLASDVDEGSTYFFAKEALNKFSTGIEDLDLDAETKKGMYNLTQYLHKKIDRRMNLAV